MRRRTLFGAIVLPAALGVLASFGVASASSLDVDGGVLQTWEIPSGLGPKDASSVECAPHASDHEPLGVEQRECQSDLDLDPGDDPDSADLPIGTDVGTSGPGD